MGKKRINDGLNKWQRYRLKDLEGYRKKKREYAKTPEEREKRSAYMRVWKEKNKDRSNQLARESHHRNKHKHVNRNRNYALKRSYGITVEEKIIMVNNQNGMCGICSKVLENTRETHVDHCHKTGKIRGILCHVCNTKLAWYEKYKTEIEDYMVNN